MGKSDPEEKFNEQVWEILQKIKEEALATEKGKPVKFVIGKVVGVGIIPRRRKIAILKKLQELGAIKIITKRSESERYGLEFQWDNAREFDLEILQPKFDEVYKKYSPNDKTKIQISKKEFAETLISDLETKYEEITEEQKEDQFFIKLADYGKYLIESDVLSSLLASLKDDSQKDLASYRDKRNEFYNKLVPLSKDLLGKAARAGLKDDPTSPFISQIAQLKARIQDLETSFFDEELDYFYTPYRELIERFVNEGKRNLIKKHLIQDTNTPKLFKEYSAAHKEWEKFKKIRENTVWWAHYNITRIAAGVYEINKEYYFPKDDAISDIYRSEINSIVEGRATVYLNRKKFETWLKRLHRYILSRMGLYKEMQKMSGLVEKRISEMMPDIQRSLVPYQNIQKELNEIAKRFQFELPNGFLDSVRQAMDMSAKIPNLIEPNRVYATFPIRDTKETLLSEILWELRSGKQNIDVPTDTTDEETITESNQGDEDFNDQGTIAKFDKITIIRESRNQAKIHYPGLGFSKPVSINTPWFKVFKEFVENVRVEKKRMVTIWNLSQKNSYSSTRKVREGVEYAPKIRRLILDGLKRNFPEVNGKIEINKAKGFYKGSYKIDIN